MTCFPSMPRRSLFGRRAISIALLALAVPTLAAAQYYHYDAPSLALAHRDRASISLQVTAGPRGATEGFVVEWMTRTDYDALAGWPAAGHPAIGYCSFYGVPTLTTGPSASYGLGPNASIRVELGDLYDETGIYSGYVGELTTGVEYMVRAYAGYGGAVGSLYSNTLSVSTLTDDGGCVLTQGYWKNHAEDWPTLSLTLGTTVYTQAELLDILNTPAEGNGLIFLAHQLIAAKLNVAAGATSPGTLIADADALVDGLVIPPIGNGFLDPAVASPLTDALDNFNSGAAGVPHCDPVSVEAAPWGAIKSFYR